MFACASAGSIIAAIFVCALIGLLGREAQTGAQEAVNETYGCLWAVLKAVILLVVVAGVWAALGEASKDAKVQATREGYEEYDQSAPVQAGRTTPESVTLRRSPAPRQPSPPPPPAPVHRGVDRIAPTNPPDVTTENADRAKEVNTQGYRLAKRGKHAEALKKYVEATRLNPGRQMYWFNVACMHSRLGQNEQALQNLTRWVRTHATVHRTQNWGNITDVVNDDEDLAGLRADPRFEAWARRIAP